MKLRFPFGTTLAGPMMAGAMMFGCMLPVAVREARGADLGNALAAPAWQAIASDGVQSSLQHGEDGGRPTLRLHFDFAGHGGYAGLHRDLPLEFPDNFQLQFRLRGEAPLNNLEIKFIDASGENVWWIDRPNLQLPGDWQTFKFKRRHTSFAWGPVADHVLRKTAALEFVISAGSGGGSGQVEIADLSLKEIPAPGTAPMPQATASSELAGNAAANTVDGDAKTAWRSDPAGGLSQQLTLDLGIAREFGGMTLRWLPGLRASNYEVQAEDDDKQWHTLRTVSGGTGDVDRLYLPESEATHVRLLLKDGPGHGYGLSEWRIEDLAFGTSLNDFFSVVAQQATRGTYPRGYVGEQSYWTVVGNSGGRESGLLSEDGAFELKYGGASLEPWIALQRQSWGWADVRSTQSLRAGYLPQPRVTWSAKPFTLRISAMAYGSAGNEHGLLRYRYCNSTSASQSPTLALLARPFQVNPPTQFLNGAGGVKPLHSARWDGASLYLNDQLALTPLLAPTDFTAASYDAGATPQQLLQRSGTPDVALNDEFGFGAVALRYALQIAAHACREIAVDIPWSGSPQARFAAAAALRQWLSAAQQHSEITWQATLNQVQLKGPPGVQALFDRLRSALAQVLINRDGPAIQPGTRSYRRSWIRDGALSSAALLALGHEAEVRDYLDWYTPYLFDTGKVPCCVDRRGADPVPENDSSGELLFLAWEYYRYTGDRERLAALWPRLQQVAAYLEFLSASERTAAHQLPDTQRYYALMPASISHEGYSAKPMHSYWDDFWALKGFDAATAMARALNDTASTARYDASAKAFRTNLGNSLRSTAATLNINFLPGAAELGDFDPTSTTIALSPQGELDWLPADLLNNTFERYWSGFTARRDGNTPWDAYTPYELRNVGAMLRLGWPERARAALDWFINYQRPAAWNQWAEVVGRDPRTPRFVGDMPHGWVASDFIRSALDLFAYERGTTLVLAAGVAPQWLDAGGLTLAQLRTPYGPLSYQLKRKGLDYELHLDALARTPAGGIVLVLPGGQHALEVSVPNTTATLRISAKGKILEHR